MATIDSDVHESLRGTHSIPSVEPYEEGPRWAIKLDGGTTLEIALSRLSNNLHEVILSLEFGEEFVTWVATPASLGERIILEIQHPTPGYPDFIALTPGSESSQHAIAEVHQTGSESGSSSTCGCALQVDHTNILIGEHVAFELVCPSGTTVSDQRWSCQVRHQQDLV